MAPAPARSTTPSTSASPASSVVRTRPVNSSRTGNATATREPMKPSVNGRPLSRQSLAGSNGTPRSQQSTAASQSKVSRQRGSLEKENESKTATRPSTRRVSTTDGVLREKPASKDGTAQRAAKGVEGLKDFQLGDCLGKGAFGSVYRALNWSTGETVAIKQVRLVDLPRAELNVIMQEIDLLKNLHHPNIVKYHGFVKTTDSLYIILEYCENGSLHSICKNFGKFPENLVSLYTAQVLRGLLFLHEQGVIHRDIKGANILTTKEGLVKLADFGVATKQQGLSEGSVVGTPYWMAPEVIELAGATTASDIWSLGCTVIELLNGRPPYHKLAPMPALFRIVNDDHPPLPEGASPLVRDFLMQCFQKDPNLRVSAKKLLKHPWIASTNKTEAKKPPEYDETVKSVQEWNEALKASPPGTHVGRGPLKTSPGRAASKQDLNPRSPPMVLTGRQQPSSSMPAARLQTIASQSQPTGAFQSPSDNPGRDNWDDDFESLSAVVSGLRLPEHLKPRDNFQGLFSSEKLKQFASTDYRRDQSEQVEAWDQEFEGDFPGHSLQQPLGSIDDYDTVRPFPTPKPTEGLKKPSNKDPDGISRKISEQQPKTQILNPIQPTLPEGLALLPPRPTLTGANGDKYREGDDEDYNDLVPTDDKVFQSKVAKYHSARPVKPGEYGSSKSKLRGSVRQHGRNDGRVHDAAAIRRTRSSLEIQKYAENEDDEDFDDLHFGENNSPKSFSHQVKTRSPKSTGGSSESNNGSDKGTLQFHGSPSIMFDEEDDDDDDPFAALEEELDDVDLELNVARDKHARLCTLVEGLVSDLKLSQPEDVLGDIVDELLQTLSESPDVKNVIVSSHGMLPVLELLETCTRPHTILRLLKIVNCIISDNVEVQENLCFVGGIPIISKFAHKRFAAEIRLEAAAFVRMMYQTSRLTLQMFISCGGLNVLVEFLEEEYEYGIGRDLVLIGVNGVWSVFELQGPTPKNDFCRIFSRSSVLYPLSLVLNRVLDEDSPEAEIIEGRIVNIFLLFSQAENHVKETVTDRMVIKRVLKDLKRMSPVHQITMLKFIKNLSMLATTLDALQNSNAIEVLTDLLSASMNAPHFTEISNQTLNIMYNLCRLSKARQEDAALSGVIPLLQRIVKTERPLKEFALPILCDMAHSGKVGRKVLWQNKGLQFYVSLLSDQYWAVTALDAIFIWLQEETAKVEEHLLGTSAFADAVLTCFNESKADAFENLLEPLQKLLRLSPPVAASLARRSLFERSGVKVHAKKPLVRLNLLRVLRSICDASEEEGGLIAKYGLLESIQNLAKHDSAILVREMANDLVKSCEQASSEVARPAGIRRSSSSAVTTPILGPASLSLPPTPVDVSGSSRGTYFDRSIEALRSPRPSSGSPYRSATDANSNGVNGRGMMGTASRSSRRLLTDTGAQRTQSRMSYASPSSVASLTDGASERSNVGLAIFDGSANRPGSGYNGVTGTASNANRERETSYMDARRR